LFLSLPLSSPLSLPYLYPNLSCSSLDSLIHTRTHTQRTEKVIIADHLKTAFCLSFFSCFDLFDFYLTFSNHLTCFFFKKCLLSCHCCRSFFQHIWLFLFVLHLSVYSWTNRQFLSMYFHIIFISPYPRPSSVLPSNIQYNILYIITSSPFSLPGIMSAPSQATSNGTGSGTGEGERSGASPSPTSDIFAPLRGKGEWGVI
jgi:hypothetical protein